MPVQNPPAGYHTVTPYLTTTAVAKLIEFLQAVFDATVVERMIRPDGSVGHCEVRIGDSIVMMGEPPDPSKVRPSNLYVYVPDVDATYRRALAHGAHSEREPANQFYGDRSGGFVDASGNTWWIATHHEDVSPEELRQRAMQGQ
jgi:PhnB protein